MRRSRQVCSATFWSSSATHLSHKERDNMAEATNIAGETLAEGYNAFDTSKAPHGTVKYLGAPVDVIDLIKSGKLKEHILLVQGGTTTFLAPALSMGAIGVITMSGAPESHLGILAREFQIPCVMTAHLTSSQSRFDITNTDQSSHFDEIVKKLDGRPVRLDCSDHDAGLVIAE